MNKLPLVLLILNLIFVYAAAQTKPKSKPKKTPVKLIKAVTPNKPEVPVKTPTPALTPIINLSKFEAEILAELNLFRANPQEYAKYLEDYLKNFDGKYFKSGEGISLESFEGKTPVEEIIQILKVTSLLPEFRPAYGMTKAASDHLQDLMQNNKTGHRGTNGSLPNDRVKIYGIAPSGVNENITYNAKTARDVVLTMLIDDGNKSRNHRKNLLNPQLKMVGLATGEIKQIGLSCVLVLTPYFIDKPQ